MNIELRLDDWASHGNVVARHESRVVFVRGGLPGELVTAEVTDDSKAHFWRARVVVEPSPDRIEPTCPSADSCGGCDFQHASHSARIAAKTHRVRTQLARAGIDWSGQVASVSDEDRYWRTRMRYAVADGVVGLRQHRSGQVASLPKQGCELADRVVPVADIRAAAKELGSGELLTVTGSDVALLGSPEQLADEVVTQKVLGREYRLGATGFWQVHRAAAEVLTSCVLEMLLPVAGQRALDLYCGAGLFAGALDSAGCSVTGIEANRAAVEFAKQNVPNGEFFAGQVAKHLRHLEPGWDLAVLDPPRSGAGADVVKRLVALAPEQIAYVSCDPATLASDLERFQKLGYAVLDVRAFDLFPLTHHVETVASLFRFADAHQTMLS